MNDYKGFKSQALDFNVYSDGIGVLSVTPQYALTRENTNIEYYSTDGTWKTLTVETTVDKAIGKIQGKDQDAWWVGDGFGTLLKEYWNKANAYSNIIWTRDETIYDGDKPTLYSDPREDAGGSAISQWCLDNDRTLINGAHIATGTVTAQQIDTGLLNAAGVVVTSPNSSDMSLPEPAEETLDISKVIQPMKASGSIFGVANTYTLALVDKHAGLRLDLNELEEDQTYKLKFTFTDLSGASTGNVPVTRLGGNIGWPIVNFRILRATIDGSPVLDPSSYGTEGPTGGYVLTEAPGHKYDIEIEFVYMGMNNPDGTDNANNYFYISPNRCLADPEQTTYTQITITEISCKPCQYILISQGSFVTPAETDPNWTNEFPDWRGKGSVWRRIATKTLGVDGTVTYNYGPAQLLTAGECAKIKADKAGESVGDWCQAHDVTILDGANIMTGTIDASKVHVTNLDASNITAGMFTVGTDTNNDKELTDSEIIFQAGYDADEEPQVKIGGFTVTSDSLYSHDTGNSTVGIQLTSGKTGTAKVIQAGTKFNVDASGNIKATGGTIGGFEIGPSRLLGGTPKTETAMENVIALYAPLLPLEVDFSSETGSTSENNFTPQPVTFSWNSCVETSSTETWGTIEPRSSEVGTNTTIRKTSSWVSFASPRLTRLYPQLTIESDKTISGILRDTSGTEQKDENGNTLTTTGNKIENLVPEDIITYHFNTTGISIPYKTSEDVSGNTGVIVKQYVELRLYNSSSLYAGQVEYRFVIEMTPSSPWVDATYTVELKRAPQWNESLIDKFTITGEGAYTTKTWTRTFSYTQVPGGSKTDSFNIYYVPTTTSNAIPSGINIDPTKTGDGGSGTVLLGTKGNLNGYEYTTVNLQYNNSSKYFTLTETITYIVDGSSNPVVVKLTTQKYQDAAGTKCALIAGATAKWNTSEQRWKVDDKSETLRIEHDGRLRLKDGIEFYEQGIEYTGTWGQTSGKSWATSHNAGSSTYKWWNTDTGGNPDRWKSFAQVGVNKTYNDSVGLTESATDAAQSPATLFLAASTNAFHTNWDHPFGKRYQSSAIIRAAATPMYDSNCTAELTLSRYNIDLVENTSADAAARTTITPDNIETGSIQTRGSIRTSSVRSDNTVTINVPDTEDNSTGQWVFSGRILSNTAINTDSSGKYIATGNSGAVVGMSGKGGFGYALWAGEEDNLHEKAFRVGHTGELYCKNGYFSNDLQLKNLTVNTSDRNAKKNIELLPVAYETVFDQLQPVRFRFIENQSERYHTGFIAQDIKEAVENAELTTQDFAAYCEWINDDGSKSCGIRYGELIALNTDQIQKLKTRVAELEATVAELTKLINEKLNQA